MRRVVDVATGCGRWCRAARRLLQLGEPELAIAGVNAMRMMTRVSIAGLIMVGAAHAYAETTAPAGVSLETPISTVHVDAQGNITRITFANGADLSQPQLNLRETGLQGVDVSGIRVLPFQLLPGADPTSPQMVVVAEFADRAVVAVPSGAGAVLGLNRAGQVVRVEPSGGEALAAGTGGEALRCPPGECYFYGECEPCPSKGLHALIEYRDRSTGQTQLGVLALEPGAPVPEPGALVPEPGALGR